MKRIERLLVLGGGSAGFIAAITLKTKLPHLPIRVIRSREIGIIGVGESTTPYTPDHLHGYLRIDLAEFHREVQPSWKLGIKFLWGERPHFNYTFNPQTDSQFQQLRKTTGYYFGNGAFPMADIASALMEQNKGFLRQEGNIPYIGRDVAYHLENVTFVAYLERVARRLGIEVVDDKVVDVVQDESGVRELRLESGNTESADLYIDCSGFRSVLLGKAFAEPFVSFKSTLLCNRAVIGGWKRGPDEPILPYTTAETMNAGWCWRIDHEHLINRGYVFSSDFLSDEEAEREFRAKNPRVDETKFIHFVSGRYVRPWVKNVVAIGNSSGFVEPLESTAIVMICGACQALTESLVDCDRVPNPALVQQFNQRNSRGWDALRAFLAVHYRFNTRLQTPFWKACCAEVDLAGAEPVVDYYRQNGPSVLWKDTLIDTYDQFKLDGYYILLLGQMVPHERTYQASESERDIWQRIQAAYLKKAQEAFRIEDVFPIIRSPHWQWNQDFYTGARRSNA